MNDFMQDLRYAFRTLRKNPGFALGAIIALTLGIGANTAIFSVVYATLIRALPYPNPDRLVIVWESKYQEDPKDENVLNPANFADLKEQNKVFEDMAAWADGYRQITTGGEPLEVAVQYANPNLFTLLGAKAFLGRTFVWGDENSGEPVVVISHGLWLRRFGGDPKIVGETIIFAGQKRKVLGVMPPNFRWFIKKGSFTGKEPEIWQPFAITPEQRTREGRYLTSVARLKPGVTVDAAQSEVTLIGKRFEQQYREFNTGWNFRVVPLRQQISGSVKPALLVLSGAVGLVLLIACGNVASLMLVRAVSRSREIAVRAALGAGRWRIIRQLLAESFLLAIVSGASGLLVAFWGLEALRAFRPVYGIDFQSVDLNAAVLLYTMIISLLTAILFGLIPALQATRWNLQETLKESSRGVQLSSGKARNSLVVAEMALALILLAGAGLLIRSFIRLTATNPGFNPRNIVTVRVLLANDRYPEPPQRIQYFQEAIRRIEAIPGVESAGATTFPPFAGPASGTDFYIEGRPEPPEGQEPVTEVLITDAKYFRTMQIPLKRGRLFTDAEATEAKRVVLINEALVRKYFGNEDPIGKNLTINMRDPDRNPPTRVIGIVGDAKHQNLDSPVEPTIFWPHPELPLPFMTFLIRVKGNPVFAIPGIHQVLRSVDPQLALSEFRTLEEAMGDTYARNQFNMMLLMILAGVAFTLSVIGIYGVMSHSVVQRTQEMGIRMALGARSEDVLKMVLKQGGKLILYGACIGLAGSLAVTWLMKSLLFGTSPTDGGTFTLVTLIITIMALLACWVPARRASKVDPATALRYE